MQIMDYWNNYAKRLLKSELVKKGVSHQELSELLIGIGVKETKSSIDSKISRGSFSAAFFFQCMSVIGCAVILMEESVLLNKAAEPRTNYKLK